MYVKSLLLVIMAIAAMAERFNTDPMVDFLSCNCRIAVLIPWYTSGFL